MVYHDKNVNYYLRKAIVVGANSWYSEDFNTWLSIFSTCRIHIIYQLQRVQKLYA